MTNTAVSLLSLVLALFPDVASADESVLKAVMQINSQNMVVISRGLRDSLEVANQVQAAHSKLDLKLIVYGPALDQFMKGADAELRGEFQKLAGREDIQVYAAEETLKRIHKGVKDLLPGFKTVPSGPFEVLKLERAGYLYLKP